MVGESAYNWITNFLHLDKIDSRDRRKREYGDLNDIKYRTGRSNSVKRHHLNKKNVNKYRNFSQNRKSTQTVMHTNNNKIKDSWWKPSIQKLKLIFSNDTENITNMRVACEDFSLLSNNPRHTNDHLNRNKIIRERIRQSRSFKKKLAERDYDKRQLDILKRSSLGKGNNPITSTTNNNTQLNNDKMVLLERQNKRLRKELLQRESELRILKKELRFLKVNKDLMKRDEILNLLSADSNTIDKIYDKENISNNSNHYNNREPNPVEEQSRSFSPVQIDYSQYSR
ncbi:hypothetical protein MOSE0_D02828 [Monosporozyma servazzii]